MHFEDGDIRQIVKTICDSVIGNQLSSSEMGSAVATMEVDDEHVTATMSSCIQITGAWVGAIVLCAPQQFSRLAAAKMFGVEALDCTMNDLQDALAELTNMVGGNFKGMLPLNETCQLSLPAVVSGNHYSARIPGGRIVQSVAVEYGVQTLVVHVLEKN